jgi:alpha-N-arabinofuranosidase
VRLTCEVQGAKVGSMKGRVLTAPEINAHNTFAQPETVKPSAFEDFSATQKGFEANLPAKSIVMLEL